MPFIPNTTALLSRMTGMDVHSEPTFSPAIKVECGIVGLNMESLKTSVRADSSASRGTIEEEVIAGKILFLPKASPAIGDKVVIQAMTLRCKAVQPRLAVTGDLDHYECKFEVWFDEA